VFAFAITAQSSLSPRDASLPRCRCRGASWYARDKSRLIASRARLNGLVFGFCSLVAGNVVKMSVSPVGGGGVAVLDDVWWWGFKKGSSRKRRRGDRRELGRLAARWPKLSNHPPPAAWKQALTTARRIDTIRYERRGIFVSHQHQQSPPVATRDIASIPVALLSISRHTNQTTRKKINPPQ
jgi:hypothetical protein